MKNKEPLLSIIVPVYDVDLHGQLLRSKDVVETHQIDYYKPL